MSSSTSICKTSPTKQNPGPPDVLYSALRRVFYKFSCGGIVHESDFIYTCRHVSTFLNRSEFNDLIESVQELFVDVVEMAVITFISRIFPIVRLSILSLAEYYVPESCETISSLFDLLDVQVNNCCGYGLQLRMAAIDQLLQSDETVVATLPKTFNLSLFAEKCRSMMITASDMPSALQLSEFPLADQPANDYFSSFGEISLTSSPSIGQEDPPSPECLYPTWSTPRSSLELLVTGTWIYNSPPSLDVDLDRLIRAAAERELSSCADLLFNSNLQASMQSSVLQTSSKVNPLITGNAPSPISQTFFLDMKSLSSSNLEALESDDPSALDLAPITISQDSSRNTAVQDRPLDHHRISPSSLQAHDHSRQSSIDLALVPPELLKPYSTKNCKGPEHRRPLSRINAKFNASSNPDSASEILVVEPATIIKLSRAEAEDLFGYAASSSPGSAQEEDEGVRSAVTGDVLPDPVQPISTSRNRSASPASHVIGAPVSSVEIKTPAKEKRKRRSSDAVTSRKRKGKGINIGVDTGKVAINASLSGDHDHPRRSTRQRTPTAQKQLGVDIGMLALPGGGTASLVLRKSTSDVNKENTR
ncbi:hypothetical protein DFH05DRAFT_1461205 [Lentinula detonsa]|uniref:Uncharacterized protein n=1 Tax=Lentinula detonsa TaxID=2804962 RepID=A0A9W8NYB5_9AGAR|nr:hypothetical protein DFH05DRAFT_1461205 [Lentinula detonsa]